MILRLVFKFYFTIYIVPIIKILRGRGVIYIYIYIYNIKYTSTGGNIVTTAKRNCLSPKNVECLIVIKKDMAMVDDFIKKGYLIKKLDGVGPVDNRPSTNLLHHFFSSFFFFFFFDT